MLVSLHPELGDVRVSYNNTGIATVRRFLGLNITKSSRYRQTAREDSLRSKGNVRLGFRAVISALDERSILVYPAVAIQNPIHLILFRRLVVFR